MDFVPLLRLCDDTIWDARIKLVRHADARVDLDALQRSGHLLEYESRQDSPRFAGAEYLLTFLAERGTRCRFSTAYRVDGMVEGSVPWPSDFPAPHLGLGVVRYDLTRLESFGELEDRLVIDWGKGTRSWVQWLKPKPVIEILPRGYVRDFPGYDDVLLDFDALRRIVEHPDANRVWHQMLRGAAGVYLITDMVTGQQYVGSASGEGGILRRWTQYVRTRHGGNVLLRELLAAHPDRHRRFQFSILRVLPRTMAQKQVVEVESLYKRKLGSRAFGLNSN